MWLWFSLRLQKVLMWTLEGTETISSHRQEEFRCPLWYYKSANFQNCVLAHAFGKVKPTNELQVRLFSFISEFTNRLGADMVNCQILSNLRPFFFLRKTEMWKTFAVNNRSSALNIPLRGNKCGTELHRASGTLTAFESALQKPPPTPRICHGLTRMAGQRASLPNIPSQSAAPAPPSWLATLCVCCSLRRCQGSVFFFFFFFFTPGCRHLKNCKPTLKTHTRTPARLGPWVEIQTLGRGIIFPLSLLCKHGRQKVGGKYYFTLSIFKSGDDRAGRL